MSGPARPPTAGAAPAAAAAPASDVPDAPDLVVETRGLVKDHPSGDGVVHALRGVDLRVPRGRIVAVRGRSGSGKTTLLNLVGGLDRPTAGTITLDGEELTTLRDKRLEEVRRTKVAFVFQGFGLVPFLSAAENVEVPLRLVRQPSRERDARVAHLLEIVGLGGRMRHRPYELSGGEQQRVAIARALANRPAVLLADEPTGQLDSETGVAIMHLLRAVVAAEGTTAIIATHDPLMLEIADHVVELRDGLLETHR